MSKFIDINKLNDLIETIEIFNRGLYGVVLKTEMDEEDLDVEQMKANLKEIIEATNEIYKELEDE